MAEKTYVLISCEVGEEHSLHSRLMEFPGIKGCIVTYGNYDLVAEFETGSADEMDRIIASGIRKLEKIRSTVTLRVAD